MNPILPLVHMFGLRQCSLHVLLGVKLCNIVSRCRNGVYAMVCTLCCVGWIFPPQFLLPVVVVSHVVSIVPSLAGCQCLLVCICTLIHYRDMMTNDLTYYGLMSILLTDVLIIFHWLWILLSIVTTNPSFFCLDVFVLVLLVWLYERLFPVFLLEFYVKERHHILCLSCWYTLHQETYGHSWFFPFVLVWIPSWWLYP